MDIDSGSDFNDYDQAFLAPFAHSSYRESSSYKPTYRDVDMADVRDIGIEFLHRAEGPSSVDEDEESLDERRTRLVDHYNNEIWNNGLAATMLTLERYNPDLFDAFVQGGGLDMSGGDYPKSPPTICSGPGLTVAEKLACLACGEAVLWDGMEPWTGDDTRLTAQALAGSKPSAKPGPPNWKQFGSYEPPRQQPSSFLTDIANWTPFKFTPIKDDIDYSNV